MTRNAITIVTLSAVLRLELQRDAVHAIPLAGRRRTVRKQMAEMSTAAGAVDLHARHAVAAIGGGSDRAVDRTIETRPAGPALVLRAGSKERPAAAGATKRAGPLLLQQRTAAAVFGAMLAQHRELLGRQQRLPVGFC